MVPDSAKHGTFFFGCKGIKMKPNLSVNFDLGNGMYGNASGVCHHFLDRLLQISEDGVKPGSLVYFLYITGYICQLKRLFLILFYWSLKM